MTLDPRKLFLIDAVGAFVTAALLIALVAPRETLFGMPSPVVNQLAAIAVTFAFYSVSCYLTGPRNWPLFLRIIALGNLAYCVLTIVLLFVYRLEVTVLGIAYFVGETIVVAAVGIYELLTAARARN